MTILIEDFTPPSKSWCWQPVWSGVGESIYSTFAKFEALNALSLMELGQLFVMPNVKVTSTGVRRQFTADLRTIEGIDIVRLRSILKLNSEKIRAGFVATLFPNASLLACDELRWCPKCIKNGFHASAFQLNFVLSCPIHNVRIRTTCSRCKSTLPYILRPQAKDSLFQCWNCHRDLAPAIRESNAVKILKKSNADALSDYVKMLRFGDQLPTLINSCRNSLGKPNLPMIISKGQAYRQLNGFEQFVADVLTHVADQKKYSQRQFHFIQPYSIFSEEESERRAIKSNKPKDAKTTNDLELHRMHMIYKAIKRHIFRRLIKPHKSCFKLARRALWWDIDGERIKSFCPVATAFIRWRMHWESCRIPSLLDSQGHSKTPYGIVGWLAGDAPIGSSQWTGKFESWVHSTIFGCHCIGSFYSWLEHSTIEASNPSSKWKMNEQETFAKKHWAICGCGTTLEPGYIFVQNASNKTELLNITELNHLKKTAKIIKDFQR